MRIESSVTSISWIPSAAIAGATRIPFELGVTHYDDPPPDEWKDLDSVLGPEGARFANDLRAWVDVDDGKITGHGQSGGGHVSSTLVRLRGMRVQVEAIGYPELRPEPVVGEDLGAQRMDDRDADHLRRWLDRTRTGRRQFFPTALDL